MKKMANVVSRFFSKEKTFSKAIFFIVIIFLLTDSNAMASNIEYTVSRRSDRGYTLEIYIEKRHWKPITAEGFFPVEKKSYSIEIIGDGKDWSYREQNGYFYPLEQIQSIKKHWDIGYAWVDADRKYIYLNLYWVNAPDGLKRSDVSGKYTIDK
jgi:hypothetical protein